VFVFDMGHINAVVEFEAANHEDALVLAKEHFPEAHRELWQLDQFAKRLYPE